MYNGARSLCDALSWQSHGEAGMQLRQVEALSLLPRPPESLAVQKWLSLVFSVAFLISVVCRCSMWQQRMPGSLPPSSWCSSSADQGLSCASCGLRSSYVLPMCSILAYRVLFFGGNTTGLSKYRPRLSSKLGCPSRLCHSACVMGERRPHVLG